MQEVLIFFTTVIATFLSSMSGGGSSVIAMPIFLSMGISFPLATAMQKISAGFWVLPSSFNYLRGKKIDWRLLIIFATIGLVGAYFGLLVILSVDQAILKPIIGVFIIALVIYIYFKKEVGLQERHESSKTKEIFAYILALPMGFYETILGSGNGIIFAAISFYSKGFDFIKALGHYFAIAFPWVALSAIFLISKGFFSWDLVIPAVLGSSLGGYLGSKFAKYKGNKFIKLVFVIIGAFLGLKLVIGF